MKEVKNGEIVLCCCWFDCSHDIDKSMRDHFDGCGECGVIVVPTEGFIGFSCGVVRVMGCWCKGVIKKVFSFWRKVDALIEGLRCETCNPRLASFV